MSEQVAKPKTKRSVNLDTSVYERIVAMSELLGTTVNAYLVEAIGQKIYKDESMLRMERQTAQMANGAISEIVEHLKQENPER